MQAQFYPLQGHGRSKIDEERLDKRNQDKPTGGVTMMQNTSMGVVTMMQDKWMDAITLAFNEMVKFVRRQEKVVQDST